MHVKTDVEPRVKVAEPMACDTVLQCTTGVRLSKRERPSILLSRIIESLYNCISLSLNTHDDGIVSRHGTARQGWKPKVNKKNVVSSCRSSRCFSL